MLASPTTGVGLVCALHLIPPLLMRLPCAGLLQAQLYSRRSGGPEHLVAPRDVAERVSGQQKSNRKLRSPCTVEAGTVQNNLRDQHAPLSCLPSSSPSSLRPTAGLWVSGPQAVEKQWKTRAGARQNPPYPRRNLAPPRAVHRTALIVLTNHIGAARLGWSDPHSRDSRCPHMWIRSRMAWSNSLFCTQVLH